jgi:acyl dehydratase
VSWSEAPVGEALPERVVGPLTEMDFARFSISMDDPNRVHIQDSVAKLAGLPSVIGSGGIVQGLMDDVVAEWAGRATRRVVRNRILRPLLPGSTVRATGTVTERTAGAIVVAVEVRDQDGNALADATVTLPTLATR